MPIVVVKKDEPIERALKRLTKIVTKEGIIQAVKQRRFYEKPSEKRRKQAARSSKRKEKERFFR